MRVTGFEDAEDAYLAWLTANPRGFVVNTSRPPSARYLLLHRATCRTIAGAHQSYTTRDSMKVCSTSAGTLAAWGRELGGELHPCGLCRP